MAKDDVIKGPLPACSFNKALLQKLWHILAQDGEFAWEAKVGTGGDLLGKKEERPKESISVWDELVGLLQSLPRIDSVHLTVEVPDKGVIAIRFTNYSPAGGVLAITSQDQAWAEQKFETIADLFYEQKDNFITRLHSRIGFVIVHTVIPLSVSFVIVIVLAALLIPSAIRRSELVWWITAGTLIATLKLASILSDKLIIYTLKNYPYIRWLS